jgi:3-oxoacyl-[acyl-carrier protein] reductase
MDLGLQDKIAIVTGGSRGIGRACAVELAKEGARVCVTARDEDRLKETVRTVSSNGTEGIYMVADLTVPTECRTVADACVNHFGGVDILINCAGAAGAQHVLDLSTDIIDEGIRLKFYGAFRLAQLVIPYMREKKWGRILTISGMAAVNPVPGNLAAAVTNISIHMMTRSLSDAVAEDGIMVNVICPGMTNTQRARDVARIRAEKEGRDVEAIIGEFAAKLPAKRIAEPEDIAKVACFLSSDACRYIYGSSIFINGGLRGSTP